MDSKTETVSDREIAKFMNINLTLGFDVFWIVDEEDEMPDYINGTVYSPSTNWNQLMPVVEKYFEDMNSINAKFLANIRRGIVERAIWDALYKRGSIADVAKTLANEIRYLNSQSPNDTIK